uniref:Integrase-type domain-containing protein n=1 Tax=Myotis myotis TaxID=51298 RepID=A0A7J7ZYL8_MYOMY|nr:hypothetical protein mMyoMyo1_009846 [Myotis myotis]
MNKLRMLTWRDYPGLLKWTHCNHKGLCNVKMDTGSQSHKAIRRCYAPGLKDGGREQLPEAGPSLLLERAHQTLKTQIKKLQENEFKYSSPHHVLQHAQFVINILNVDSEGNSPMYRHWNPDLTKPKALVKWRDLLTGAWKGPDVLLTQGRGYACIFPQDADSPVWIPDRLVRPYVSPPAISASS